MTKKEAYLKEGPKKPSCLLTPTGVSRQDGLFFVLIIHLERGAKKKPSCLLSPTGVSRQDGLFFVIIIHLERV
jgi:hypothetical protein